MSIAVHEPNGSMAEARLTLRCTSNTCFKVLGKVDKHGIVEIKSSRSGWWIEVEMEKGWITCKKCGNRLYWDRKIIKTKE